MASTSWEIIESYYYLISVYIRFTQSYILVLRIGEQLWIETGFRLTNFGGIQLTQGFGWKRISDFELHYIL